MTRLTNFSKILISILIIEISISVMGYSIAAILLFILFIFFLFIIYYSYKEKYMINNFADKVIYFFIYKKSVRALEFQISRLHDNLRRRSLQIGQLRGKMRQLEQTIFEQKKEIEVIIQLAEKAKMQERKAINKLKNREAQRKQSGVEELESAYKMMEITYRILTKIYENTEMIFEDTNLMKKNAIIFRTNRAEIFITPKRKIRILLLHNSRTLEKPLQQRIRDIESYLKMINHFPLLLNLETGFLEKKKLNIFRQKYPEIHNSLIESFKKKDNSLQPLERELLDLVSL